MSYFNPRQEAEEFEATGEDMELYSLRREAEREAAMEAAHEEAYARLTFKDFLAEARKGLISGIEEYARANLAEAEDRANTPGRMRLIAALSKAINTRWPLKDDNRCLCGCEC